MRGKAPALALLFAGLSCPVAVAQTPLVSTPPSDSTPAGPIQSSPPVVFRHDFFYLDLASAFSAAALPVTCEFPGPMGLTEDRLAARVPGVEFRRNGVPFQAGEFHWFGGDGEDLGFHSDRTSFNLEPLGFPGYGAGDPIAMPPLGDTLYLVAAPLFGARPAEMVSWRNPLRPDSLIAIALHANGPDGFSHTGGRLQGPIGGGAEFDGTFYRDFSNGTLADAAGDGHTLDFELRKRVSGWPTRLRFRQTRGERLLGFRWEPTAVRADHRYLFADLSAEAAHADSTGEWSFQLGLRHEDQKLANPLLSEQRTWFGRTIRVAASRLDSGAVSRVFTLSGNWRPRDSEHALPEWKALELSGVLQRARGSTDLALSAALGTETGVAPTWRAALALAWRISAAQRLVAAVGRSREAPSYLRQWLPAATGPGGFAEAGDPALDPATHESASLAWNYAAERRGVSLLAAAGRSTDLPVWQPGGTSASSYVPSPLERRYAGLGGVAYFRPHHALRLEGACDYTLLNRWEGDGDLVYAPKLDWYSRLSWSVHLSGTHADFIPSVDAHGAAGGTLPVDYTALGVGIDLSVKQLLIFWRLANLSDEAYRTGGEAMDYGRHFEYGFRWEFVN